MLQQKISLLIKDVQIPIEEELPADAIAAYPFLSRLSKGQWFQIRETETGSYAVALIPEGEPKAEGVVAANLSREERERLEYDLLRADWISYDIRPHMVRMNNLPGDNA